MQRVLSKIAVSALALITSISTVFAQEPTSVDPILNQWATARIPKEYTIASIKVSGAQFLDTTLISSISNLTVGQKFMHPGTDIFAKAITNLWKQKLFANVQVFITKIEGTNVHLEIAVQERPRLSNYKFFGVKKSDQEDLLTKVSLVKQTIITENVRRNIIQTTEKFYKDKGFNNVFVSLQEEEDPVFKNSRILNIHVQKGIKVKVNDINFYGNETVSGYRLKRQMKGTKEKSRFTLFPIKDTSLFGAKETYTFDQYAKDWGFLTYNKTKQVLDPYVRVKLFGSAKFNKSKFDEDQQKLLNYYNSLGYRDAQILDTAIYPSKTGHLNIDIKVNEGRQYYFGDITFKGNMKYSDSVLNYIMAINKGDIYNIETLNKRMGKQMSPEGGNDISSLYMDDGYLFFQIEAVETRVYNDTIDYEIRIKEGPQATIGRVAVKGNNKTKDYVILRELRTIPGQLFSRSDIIRSQRELANLQFFNQESINPDIVPNPEEGTVDITWGLEEKSSDQLELSAGWGGGIGLTGTVGVVFNNFSIKNIFKKEAWDPLPMGDGQKLSLRVQSNGRAYRSYNFSFSEPWLGGKKRNSFTIGINDSKYSNAYQYDQYGNYTIDKARSDTNYLKSTGLSVAFGKQLKWPDDFFQLIFTLNYTRYKLRNYPIFDAEFRNGVSNNFSAKITLQRSSVFNPIFPTSGSNFMGSVQFTPPYSAFNKNIANTVNKYKNPEYHKWRFNAEWFVPIGQPLGAERDKQFVLRLAAKYGYMGRYTKSLDFSPFERFQVGDAGLTNNFGLLGYDIIAHRGYPVYQNSDPNINPDNGNSASQFFTIFNKYTLETRFPIVTNPSSTIYGLAFFEAANGWYDYKSYNPFKLRRSVGVGMRFYLPMFGLLGFDYGIGLDKVPGTGGNKGAGRFTFMLGFEPE